MLRRAYFWAPPLLLDPFDLYDRIIKPALPEIVRVDISFPSGWGLIAFIGLLIWTALWTYYEAYSYTDKVKARKDLAVLRLEGVQIRNRGRRLTSLDEVEPWMEEINRWTAKLIGKLETIDAGDAALLDTLDRVPPPGVPLGSVPLSENHLVFYKNHDCRLEVLERLIYTYMFRN